MRTYRRILAVLADGGQDLAVLRRLGELARERECQVLAVALLDPRSGIESDGPAGRLPAERVARRAPAARKRLEARLARNGLAWVEVRVLCGEPALRLPEVIGEWRPELVLAGAGRPPADLPASVDVLTVGHPGLLRRMAALLHIPAPRHA